MALEATRDQVVGFRMRSGSLDTRLPPGAASLRRAAAAGLSDSMPRAAVLSLHARVDAVEPAVLDDPALTQVWGPRFSAYVVAEADAGVFTLGRHPDSPAGRRRAEDLAARLADLLGEASMPYGEAGRALGEHPNRLRYATTTGTIRIAWDGARQPTIRSVPRPDLDPGDARAELARRYLRALGPGTPEGFGAWAGIKPRTATATFGALASSLLEVRTPIGLGWILGEDEPALRAKEPISGSVRLLPSGDVLYLLWGEDRAMLVPDPDLRPLLWTPRVWPGAVVVDGEVVGTWRRAGHRVTVAPWRGLDSSTREKIEAEAASLPLPVEDDVVVGWEP